MSIDHDVSLALGGKVTGEELRRTFGREVPAVSHVEPRWDPMTGQATEPEVVVDQPAYGYYVLEGDDGDTEEFDFEEELAEAIAEKIGCTHASWFNQYDHGDPYVVLFGPTVETNAREARRRPQACEPQWQKDRASRRRLNPAGRSTIDAQLDESRSISGKEAL